MFQPQQPRSVLQLPRTLSQVIVDRPLPTLAPTELARQELDIGFLPGGEMRQRCGGGHRIIRKRIGGE